MLPSIHVEFEGISLEALGDVIFSRSANFESQGGRPTTCNVNWTIQLTTNETGFAANAAIVEGLLAALNTGEGRLIIEDDEGGLVVDAPAKVLRYSEPLAWRQYQSQVSIEFSTVDRTLATVTAGMTLTPVGGTAVELGDITDWKEGLTTSRPTVDLPNRNESRAAFSGSGKIHADPGLSETARRNWLLAKAAAIRAAGGSREATIAYGNQSYLVRVDKVEAQLAGQGSEYLIWSIEAHQRSFPTTAAEADFRVVYTTDHTTGTVRIAVTGEVRAPTESDANAKVASIRAIFQSGRGLQEDRVEHQQMSDAATGDYSHVKSSFSLGFIDLNASVVNWNLTVSTKRDVRSGQVTTTYSGSVLASSQAVALAKARDLGKGKMPFPLTESETNQYEKSGEGDVQRHMRCDFSYDYQTGLASGEIHAEVRLETAHDFYGPTSVTIQGTVRATSAAAALTFGRLFKQGGYLVLSEQEGQAHEYRDTTSNALLQQVTFTYSYLAPHTEITIGYAREESNDYEAQETMVTYSGTVFAATENLSRLAVTSLTGGSLAGRRMNDRFNARYKLHGSKSVLEGYDFSVQIKANVFQGVLALPAIWEASFQISRTFAIQQVVVTPIVFGTPVVQTGLGLIPGSIVLNCSLRGNNLAAMREWARGKRALVTGGSTYAQPPKETESTIMKRYEQETVKEHTFDAEYPYHAPTLTM